MHYKNGREAKTGDPVIVKDYNKVIAGIIHSLNEGATSCNGQVAYATMGGMTNACVSVGDCFHAEDALACTAAEWEKSKTAMAAN